jgi:hypothetical protein
MSLFLFVRERIVPINAVIALSLSLSLALDFLAPKAPYLAWLSYALAGVVLACMAAELIAPVWVGHWLDRSTKGAPGLFKRLWMGYRPAWRSPAWQAVAVITCGVLVLGQVSKAKAAEGGILASQFPSVSSLQAALLDLKKYTQAIKQGVDELNAKVDDLKAFGKYYDAAHALNSGDVVALQAFVAKGEPLPPANTANDYSLASGMSYKRAGRLELLGLYVKDGFDINQRGRPLALAVDTTPKHTADKLDAWGKATGTLYGALRCELTLLHVAIITTDHEAIKWLVEHGAKWETQGFCYANGLNGKRAKPFTAKEIQPVANNQI